jgi:hypothetical protein
MSSSGAEVVDRLEMNEDAQHTHTTPSPAAPPLLVRGGRV